MWRRSLRLRLLRGEVLGRPLGAAVGRRGVGGAEGMTVATARRVQDLWASEASGCQLRVAVHRCGSAELCDA